MYETEVRMDSIRLLDEGTMALPFKKSRSSWGTALTRIATSIALLAVGVLIGLVAPDLTNHETHKHSSPIPTQLQSPTVPTIFAPDDRYIGPSRNAHRAWEYLLRNHETVFVPAPSDFNLGPGFPPKSPSHNASITKHYASEDRFYRISNIHQLHCVNMVRIRYFDLLQGHPDAGYDPRDWAAHVDHCFEYLRQSITCGDTMVLEGSSPPGSPREWRVDEWDNPLGWGTRRECIDWEGLVDWQGRMSAEYDRA